MTELLTEGCGIVGVDLGGRRIIENAHVGEPGTEEVRVGPGVHVHQHPLCGDALGAVRSDRVAMIKMSHLLDVEVHRLLFPVQAHGHVAFVVLLDGAEIAVCYA